MSSQHTAYPPPFWCIFLLPVVLFPHGYNCPGDPRDELHYVCWQWRKLLWLVLPTDLINLRDWYIKVSMQTATASWRAVIPVPLQQAKDISYTLHSEVGVCIGKTCPSLTGVYKGILYHKLQFIMIFLVYCVWKAFFTFWNQQLVNYNNIIRWLEIQLLSLDYLIHQWMHRSADPSPLHACMTQIYSIHISVCMPAQYQEYWTRCILP